MIGALTWRQFAITREADSWVSHTYQVIGAAKDFDIALRDAERGERTFVLTGDDGALAPYRGALDRLPELLARLRALTGDNSAQQDRLRALNTLMSSRLQLTAKAIQSRRDGGPTAAVAALQIEQAQHLMTQIGSLLGNIATTEELLLQGRQAQVRHDVALTEWLALAGSVLAIGVLVFAARLLARSQAQLERAETEQRAMAEQLQTAFDSVSQGIAVFDAHMALVRWNETFPLLLGIPAATMRAGTRYAAVAATVAGGEPPLLESAEQIRDGMDAHHPGEPVIFERTRTADARSFELRRTATPAEGFVLTISDITERVRADAAARDAQRLQAIGQLTGGIAHDFNNLLTIILGNLEVASTHLKKGSPTMTRIERAIWGVQRGAALTQQLLAFARRQPLAPATIDLSLMLADMANLLRRSLGGHVEIRVVEAGGLWPAIADPTQLESALLNLALNARDAMPEGGVLTIEASNTTLDPEYARQHAEVTPGDYVMLAVADTGCGMTDEVAARAFDPFFSTKQPGQGTGLGLAMVFGFAKQSGGHVTIESAPGAGTTVRLYLPRAVAAALPTTRQPGDAAELPQGSATILVIEDEEAVREVTAAMLRDLGYRVIEAADGAAAARVLAEYEGRVDLLLVDIVLPGGARGNEVAHSLARTRPGIRVLFMSGYPENAIVHGGRLDAGVLLIGKPFQREQLARRVADVLGAEPVVAGGADS